MESKNDLIKRKRTPNFTAEEKLRFVRLMREEGQCIISKVTSHDTFTNKEKELAWQNITAIHNSSGYYKRPMDALKKLWTKLKSEAKTFKAASHRSITGTGGGPGKHFDDPVLELVVELTGRGSTGIMNVDDCDAEIFTDEPDKSKVSSTPVPAPAAAAAAASASTVEDNLDAHFHYEFLDDKTDEEDFLFFVENESPNKTKKYEIDDEKQEIENWPKRRQLFSDENETPNKQKKYKIDDKKKKDDWAKRRQPKIAKKNARTDNIRKQHECSNSFAAERLKAEKEKNNLIKQKINQNCELHEIAMNNEKLKNQLLKMLIKKVSAGTIGTEEAVNVLECADYQNYNL